MNLDLTKITELLAQFWAALTSGNLSALAVVGVALYFLFFRKAPASASSHTDAALLLLGSDADKALKRAVAEKYKG